LRYLAYEHFDYPNDNFGVCRIDARNARQMAACARLVARKDVLRAELENKVQTWWVDRGEALDILRRIRRYEEDDAARRMPLEEFWHDLAEVFPDAFED
jgi:hypothetical protein